MRVMNLGTFKWQRLILSLFVWAGILPPEGNADSFGAISVCACACVCVCVCVLAGLPVHVVLLLLLGNLLLSNLSTTLSASFHSSISSFFCFLPF